MSRDDRDGGPLWLYRRILLAGLPGIVAAPMLGACGSLFPERGSLRFRVVVEVDSPSGLKAGASVLENRNQAGASGAMRRLQNPRAECFGEAVVVDLGEGARAVRRERGCLWRPQDV